jgi:HD-GYP domain-containing protein (c-di-GMP phosphodiesterase class II)
MQQVLSNSVEISVAQIRIGMYVAALDRAWETTSFLLQGFRISEQSEIEQLKASCGTLTIDPTHSMPGSYEHLPDIHVKPKRFEMAWIKRLRDRFGTFDEASEEVTKERQRLGLIPPNITPNLYGEMKPIESEVARAEEVYHATDATLELISKQVADGEKVNFDRLGPAVETMVESAIANPDALLWVARIRAEDAATYAHSVKVAIYLLQIGRHLGFPPPQLANLGAIGLLLDLGKIKCDRNLLLKQGKLTTGEFAQIKAHVDLGLKALDDSGVVDHDVRDGIAQHHERLDGSGYPSGLSAGAISIYGRMAAVADSFAALTSRRPYAEPLPAYDALKILYKQAGTHYHAPLVEQFVQAIGVFPAGSLVELTSGEVATVLAHNRIRRLEPKVLVLTDVEKKPLHEPTPLDLLLQPKAVDGSDIKIARGLPTGAYGLDLRQFYFKT